MFSLDLDAKALTKSYRCQPTSSLTACANWIYDESAATPSHGIAFTTEDAGGRSPLGPADALGTVRLMPFLPDDAPSPSQAN